jgi:hypothetical protein
MEALAAYSLSLVWLQGRLPTFRLPPVGVIVLSLQALASITAKLLAEKIS